MLWKIWYVKGTVFTSAIFTKTVLPNLEALNVGKICTYFSKCARKASRYQRGLLRNRKWKDRQYNRQKEKKTNAPIKTIDCELKYSGSVSICWSTTETRFVDFATWICHEWWKDGIATTTNKTYGYLWHRYYVTVNRIMIATAKLSNWSLQHNQWFRVIIASCIHLSQKSR